MSDLDPTPYLPRNPAVHKRHRKEVRWQITIPVIAVAVILGVFAILAVFLPPGTASMWADISLIWLIIPALFFAFIGMVVLGGLAYLTIRLIAFLPYQFYRLQMLLLKVNRGVRTIGDKAAAPIIKVNAWKASFDALRGRSSRGPRYYR
jgi:hypothetical protein